MRFKIEFLVVFLFIVFVSSCNYTPTEKYLSWDNADNVDVWNKVKAINTDSIDETSSYTLSIVGDYLVVASHKTYDKFLHIFDKNTYNYLSSIIKKGHGPNEVSKIDSNIVPICHSNDFFVMADNLKFLKINIDSALHNINYQPQRMFDWGKNAKVFPNDIHLIDDTTAIVSVIEPTGVSGYNLSIGKFHLSNGECDKFSYNHPKATFRRAAIFASADNNICGECYRSRDLLTMYDLNGNLKTIIYGINWSGQDNTMGLDYYDEVVVAKNKILVTYKGTEHHNTEKQSNCLFIFNLDGSIYKCLSFGNHTIGRMCYDDSNNRLIMLTDIYDIAYLPLEDIL